MTLTLLHKRIKFADNVSVEMLASKFLVVITRCIVSCVRISEQDV